MTRLLASGGDDAVAVLAVGDELLLGTVADTNSTWLARTLTEHGLRLVHVETVPDDDATIVAALRRLARHAATVLVSGGIGPTSDDRTREALAEACGCPLVQDEAAAAEIVAAMARRGRRANAAMLRMARRPACAAMVVNPAGSAPGVRVTVGDAVVYALPGVPSELQSMVAALLPELVARAGPRTPLVSSTVEVAVLGESSAAGMLGDVEAAIAEDPSTDLAYLARPARVSVRVSVRGEDEADARRRLDAWVGRVTTALGEHVLGPEGTTLPAAVVARLADRGQTVATAESVTGGAVVRELTTVPGASAVVRGGVTAYATDLKAALLAVPQELLDAHGPVHPEVAEAMAVGVRTVLGSSWGLATTGVAGPDPVGPHEPGEVHVAAAGPRGVQVASLTLPGDRARVRSLATAQVLNLLRRALIARESGADPRG